MSDESLAFDYTYNKGVLFSLWSLALAQLIDLLLTIEIPFRACGNEHAC